MKLIDRLTTVFIPSSESLSAAEQAFAMEMRHRGMIAAYSRGEISLTELQQFQAMYIQPIDIVKLGAIAELNKA